MNGDRFAGLADFDRDAVVLNQQSDLLGEIGPKQIRTRDAGLVHTGPGDEAVGEPRIQPRMRRSGDADEGIEGPHPRRDRLAVDVSLEPVAQELCVALVDLFEAGDGETSVGEGFGGDGRWGLDGLHCSTPGCWG
ncbi:hypothetical protein ACVWWR_003935 [Bradyrhizobium sp. LM3.2]